ncbi:MAG: HDOD domain-containing protein [Planctomycetaceae bacterium]
MLPSVVADIEVPSHLVEQFQIKCAAIKMLPGVAAEALDLANDPSCSIANLAKVIERDVKLASEILSIANSAGMGGGTPIGSLHQAIVRLGFRRCRNLILSSSLSSIMRSVSVKEESVRQQLWKHSFLTGMISLHISRLLNLGFQGEEFTAGLFHDFGRTLLAICLPETFHDFDALDFQEAPQQLHREQELAGITHCELGAWFAKRNGLPSPLVDAVLFHHMPESAHRNRQLVALTAAADVIANYIHVHGEAMSYEPRSNSGIHVLENCGIPAAVDRFARVWPEVADTAMAAYQSELM